MDRPISIDLFLYYHYSQKYFYKIYEFFLKKGLSSILDTKLKLNYEGDNSFCGKSVGGFGQIRGAFAVFLDLPRALDCVNDQLLKKLEYYEVKKLGLNAYEDERKRSAPFKFTASDRKLAFDYINAIYSSRYFTLFKNEIGKRILKSRIKY